MVLAGDLVPTGATLVTPAILYLCSLLKNNFTLATNNHHLLLLYLRYKLNWLVILLWPQYR